MAASIPHQQHIWVLAKTPFKENGEPSFGVFLLDKNTKAQDFFALIPALQELETKTKESGQELSYQIVTPYDTYIYYHPSAIKNMEFPNSGTPDYLKKPQLKVGRVSVLSDGFFEWRTK